MAPPLSARNVTPRQEYETYERLANGFDGLDADTEQLVERIRSLESQEEELDSILRHMDKAHASKRSPLADQRKNIVKEREGLSLELARKTAPNPYPPAPGPPQLAFVDKHWFSLLCNVIVMLNLSCMAVASSLQAYNSMFYVLDQLFLVWYILELAVKFGYHRSNLFLGSFSVTWWNWLDAGIVAGGIMDQWVKVLVKDLIPFPMPAVSKWLRILRLFRLLRALKVFKTIVQDDLSWTEEGPFQSFMGCVIFVNSIIMSLELDYDEWGGWIWCEHAFLIIYTFELAVRLKAFGWRFFFNDDLAWNNLDCIMVCGGAFNIWLMPAWSAIQAMLHGTTVESNASVTNILRVLRMAKILRVLRLVRLFRIVKPLYNLVVGVMAALDAMKWVLILAVLILYGGAIVFTSLIGHGYIYSSVSEVPPEAELYFGSVPQSFFSLFKLMNGDTTVVEPICQDVKGRLLFAGFMIVSNWAVLAILTSVVSDHMINSSQRILEEEKNNQMEEASNARMKLLEQFFAKTDLDKNGKVTEAEWNSMLKVPAHLEQLRDLTGFDNNTLHETFFILSEVERKTRRGSGSENSVLLVGDSSEVCHEPFLKFDSFVEHLNHDRDAADTRQITHLRYWLEKVTLDRIQELEATLEGRFEELRAMLATPVLSSSSGQQQPPGPICEVPWREVTV